jgi:hypothetical protein
MAWMTLSDAVKLAEKLRFSDRLRRRSVRAKMIGFFGRFMQERT